MSRRLPPILAIAVAVLALALTPLARATPYVTHIGAAAGAVIAFSLGCLAFGAATRVFAAGLLVLSLADMVSYRLTIYRMADLFLVAFPPEYRHVRHIRYSPTRVPASSNAFFRFKPVDVYGIGGSYLEADFCPAPRQDIVAAGVKRLFDARRQGPPPSEPRLALDPGTDEALRRMLGDGVSKLRWAGPVRFAPDPEEAARAVAAGDGESVVLTGSGEDQAAPVSGAPAGGIAVRGFTDNRLALRVENDGPVPRWLVYADAFDPRWTATVDGAPAPLLPADVAFKAVRVGPGRHEVEFVFGRPDWRQAGFAVALGLVACAVLAFLAREIADAPAEKGA